MSTITIQRPAVQAPLRPGAARPTTRLTRRGRLVVVLLGVLLALAVGVWLAAGSTATDERGVVEVEVVTVDRGETLWDIAAAASDGEDVRAMMERIESLNALESAMLVTGQELRVPLE